MNGGGASSAVCVPKVWSTSLPLRTVCLAQKVACRLRRLSSWRASRITWTCKGMRHAVGQPDVTLRFFFCLCLRVLLTFAALSDVYILTAKQSVEPDAGLSFKLLVALCQVIAKLRGVPASHPDCGLLAAGGQRYNLYNTNARYFQGGVLAIAFMFETFPFPALPKGWFAFPTLHISASLCWLLIHVGWRFWEFGP